MSLQYQYPNHQRSVGTPSDFSDTAMFPDSNHVTHHVIGAVINELNMMPPHPPRAAQSAHRATQMDNRTDDSVISSSRDSGFSSVDTDQCLVEKFHLDKQCAALVDELKTVARLTQDFERDVCTDEESNSADLLSELERKIRPFLIKLDEQIGRQENLIKKNLYKCQITDCRVNWLLKYNHFALEFRRLVEILNVGVYDELERVLRLKCRGCARGVAPKADARGKIAKVSQEVGRMEVEVRAEMAKSELSYEQDRENGLRAF